jgi:RNA polymerase sigma-70 factor (ECF subfamily)
VTTKEYNICVKSYSDGAYRFILKNIRHEADAEDVVQTAFERLWMNHANVSFDTAKSYIFTTAYRLMIDLIRKNKRIEYTETLPETEIRNKGENFELKELLEKGLQTLSEVQRSVLLLRDYEGYDYKEIGEIVNLNESQVKVYIFRARQKLQVFIKQVQETV